MKAISKGGPSIAAQQRQTEQAQEAAVKRIADPVGYMERQKQKQGTATLLGGGDQTLNR